MCSGAFITPISPPFPQPSATSSPSRELENGVPNTTSELPCLPNCGGGASLPHQLGSPGRDSRQLHEQIRESFCRGVKVIRKSSPPSLHDTPGKPAIWLGRRPLRDQFGYSPLFPPFPRAQDSYHAAKLDVYSEVNIFLPVAYSCSCFSALPKAKSASSTTIREPYTCAENERCRGFRLSN
jgi:hypothetical protein